MKKVNQPILLSGLIINIISFLLYCLILIINTDEPISVSIICLLLVITGLVLSILCVSLSFESYQVFKNKRGLTYLIITIVCTIINLFLNGLSTYYFKSIASLFTIMILLSITGATLTLVGYIQISKCKDNDSNITL